LDKTRPVLVLTRDTVRPHLTNVTVAPITSTIRGLSTEVPVGTANGLDHESVISPTTLGDAPHAGSSSWNRTLTPRIVRIRNTDSAGRVALSTRAAGPRSAAILH
jgi:hypothetical protein